MLYEVAVIKKPTKKQVEEEGITVETLILPPQFVCAKDPNSAGFKVIRDAKVEIDLDNCEVLIRPFV